MSKKQIIGKNLNSVIKILYNYKDFIIHFNNNNNNNIGYLHCSRKNLGNFYHIYYNLNKSNKAIILKIIISNWNNHKKIWNKEITIE
jgi:hypothetical protein